MKRLLKVAVGLGLVPLVGGVGIFIACFFTRSDWLALAGVLTLEFNVGCILVGVVCLGVYVWNARRSNESPIGFSGQVAGMLGVYLVNVVVAGGLFHAAVLIETAYTVRVTNTSTMPVESVRIEGGGVSINFGDVPSNATVKRYFWIKRDGELVLRALLGSQEITEVVDGYVTGSMGGQKIITVKDNNAICVE